MSLRLRLLQQPALRLDLRGLTPALMVQGADAVERLPLAHGNQLLPLAEFFAVAPQGDGDTLVLEGDLSCCDRIGWQMDGGALVVEGAAGLYAGAGMSGGALLVQGSAGALAGCEMAGGGLVVEGDVGDFAGGALPGSMDGMRGGSFSVRGNAGQRLADRMRRGTLLVWGDVGDFAASRMVAGTVAIGGSVGAHAAYGMRRGSVVFAGGTPAIAPTFVRAIADAPVAWQLLSRDLARHGGPFAALPSLRPERWLGDVAVDGRGELIMPT